MRPSAVFARMLSCLGRLSLPAPAEFAEPLAYRGRTATHPTPRTDPGV